MINHIYDCLFLGYILKQSMIYHLQMLILLIGELI